MTSEVKSLRFAKKHVEQQLGYLKCNIEDSKNDMQNMWLHLEKQKRHHQLSGQHVEQMMKMKDEKIAQLTRQLEQAKNATQELQSMYKSTTEPATIADVSHQKDQKIEVSVTSTASQTKIDLATKIYS